MRVKVIKAFQYAANGFTITDVLPSDEPVEIIDSAIPALIAEGYVEDPDAQPAKKKAVKVADPASQPQQGETLAATDSTVTPPESATDQLPAA